MHDHFVLIIVNFFLECCHLNVIVLSFRVLWASFIFDLFRIFIHDGHFILFALKFVQIYYRVYWLAWLLNFSTDFAHLWSKLPKMRCSYWIRLFNNFYITISILHVPWNFWYLYLQGWVAFLYLGTHSLKQIHHPFLIFNILLSLHFFYFYF